MWKSFFFSSSCQNTKLIVSFEFIQLSIFTAKVLCCTSTWFTTGHERRRGRHNDGECCKETFKDEKYFIVKFSSKKMERLKKISSYHGNEKQGEIFFVIELSRKQVAPIQYPSTRLKLLVYHLQRRVHVKDFVSPPPMIKNINTTTNLCLPKIHLTGCPKLNKTKARLWKLHHWI